MATGDQYRRDRGDGRIKRAEQLLREARQDPAPIRQASPSDDSKPVKGGDLKAMFSRSYDGFAVGAAWLDQIAVNDDSTLKREGVADLALYDALLDDDTAKTAFDQRALAVVERPWVVEPGDPDDPRSVQAADDLRAMMNALGWDRVTRRMLFTLWYGFGVAEGIFDLRQHDGRTIIWLADIVVPDRKWFAFTNAGELRMRTPTDQDGVAVPVNKFWSWRTGATHDFAHYGTGLAHWVYWPVWFKRNGLQFWAQYLEKYGQPTAVVPFVPGAGQEAIDEALKIGQAIGSDSAVAIPANPVPGATTGGAWLKPELIEATRSGGADSYPTFKQAMDDAIRGVIIGQPATSSRMSTGLGSGQSDVQEGVKDTQARADSDEMHESFNSTFPRWLTTWNYGPHVAAPTVYRKFDEEEDLDTIADRDSKLDDLGWQRTEDSFRDTYGDGYERKPTVAPTIVDPATGQPVVPPAANDNPTGDQRAAVFAAGDPRPLYISRPVLPETGRALLAWARAAGFTNLEALADLHVTQCYSRDPVDWFAMPTGYWRDDEEGNVTIRKGGPRAIERFGDDAVVLMFSSESMQWRAADLKEAGASFDHDPYRPHITFAKGPQTVDLSAVDAFDAKILLGPEKWEALDTDPLDTAPAFSAEQLDQVDRFTGELRGDMDAEVSAFGAAIAERVAAFQAKGGTLDRNGLRLAMLQVFDDPNATTAIAKRLALPFAAERAAEAAGVADQLGA